MNSITLKCPPIPPDRTDRILVALIGLGNLANGAWLTADDNSLKVLEGATWPWPILFYLAGISCIVWAIFPQSTHAFALSGALSAGAYFTRFLALGLTILVGEAPVGNWVTAVGATAWYLMVVFVIIGWRHMQPRRVARGR